MILTIHIARKPVIGSVASNVLKWATGGLNIDASRITTSENLSGGAYAKKGQQRYDRAENWRYKREGGAGEFEQPEGRWPANLILSHRDGCKCVGQKKVQGIKGTAAGKMAGNPEGVAYGRVTKDGDSRWQGSQDAGKPTGFADSDGKEAVADWLCVLGGPVCELGQQSGITTSSGGEPFSGETNRHGIYGSRQRERTGQGVGKGDSGTASRFFKQIQEDT